MGYSCTAKAGMVKDAMMDVLGELNRRNECNNVYFDERGNKFMYETGREQADGAVTAQVLKFLESGLVRRCGRIRIEADGTITAWHGTTPTMKRKAEQRGLARYAEVYESRPMFQVV